MSVLVLLLLFGLSASLDTFSAIYNKVPNIFLSQFGSCTLDTVPMKIESNWQKHECKLRCSSTPSCKLACYNGSTCLLSSALVTPYWVPKVSPEQSLLPFPGYICYTNWIFENDITSKIIHVSSSPYPTTNAPGVGDAVYAIDGYYCASRFSLFQAEKQPNDWLELDMGSLYSVSKVVVKVRGCSGFGINFSNVVVSVGNTSGNGNYTNYSTLGTYIGSPSLGQIVTFEAAVPIVGRHISLLDHANESFTISELKAIGSEIYNN